MPANKSNHDRKKISTLSVSIMAVCLSLLLLILVFGVVPTYLNIQALKKENAEKTLEFEKQQAILPLFARAEQLASNPFEPALPFPEPNPLAREKVYNLPKRFETLAFSHSLILTGSSLDVDTNDIESSQVSVELFLTGDLFDFRSFLIGLGRFAFFDSIETINIHSDIDQVKRFVTKIRINIEKKK